VFRGPLQGGNRIGVEVLHLTGGRIQDVDCPSLNKWDRRSDYLVESFVRRYHATRRAVGSANDVEKEFHRITQLRESGFHLLPNKDMPMPNPI
jgi:hypothetical protein